MTEETGPEKAPSSALRTGCTAVLAVLGVTGLFLALAAWSWLQSLQGHPL